MVELLSVRLLDGDVAGAFGELTQACYRRPALPEAILDAVRARPRLAKRRLLEELVADLRDGACSVLERGYLHHVERAHGLPCGSRQVVSEASGHRTAIDVRYDDFGVVVELQGRAFHDTAAAYDADADRDLAEAAAAAAHTLRVTYGQVFRTPCQSAAWIATVLHRGGWDGRLGRCKSCPTVVGEVAQFD